MVMKRVGICLAVVAVMVSALIVFTTRGAYACECARVSSDERSLKKADVVFAGYVIEGTFGTGVNDANDTLDDIYWTLLPDTTVKGVSGLTVEVTSRNGGASCGVEFDVGGRYLVFAYRRGGALETNTCTNTRAFQGEVELFGAEQVDGIFDQKPPPPPPTDQNPSWVVTTTVLSGVFLAGIGVGWFVSRSRRTG